MQLEIKFKQDINYIAMLLCDGNIAIDVQFINNIDFNRVFDFVSKYAIYRMAFLDTDKIEINIPDLKSIVIVERIEASCEYLLQCDQPVNVEMLMRYCKDTKQRLKIDVKGRYDMNSFRGKWYNFWFKKA